MKLMARDLGTYWHLEVYNIFMRICLGENWSGILPNSKGLKNMINC